jgi:hypothetical protein
LGVGKSSPKKKLGVKGEGKKSDKITFPRKKKTWARKKKAQKKKSIYWPSKLTPRGQFHPIHEIPEWDVLDDALVGAGSLKPSGAILAPPKTFNMKTF